MAVSGYREQINAEIERCRTLYHEAVSLGRDEWAQEMLHEIYQLCFDDIFHGYAYLRLFEEDTEPVNNPEIKKMLDETLEEVTRNQHRRIAEAHQLLTGRLDPVIIQIP
ncbi:MAG: hypothetical protein KJ709_08500 [Nanoarchaeota archaeon]|nr:hypothetical protein [Nanoarchaeota archaeon]